MPKVLCTGPESSGTRLLQRIAATGAEAEHRSMPHAKWWWGPDDVVDFDHVVIIVRHPIITVKSAIANQHSKTFEEAEEKRSRAIRHLTKLDPSLWLTYESLIKDPPGKIRWLSRMMGVRLYQPEPIIDENQKWLNDA